MSKEKHHGFTCPNCGSHYFGSYTHHRVMGNAYPHGTRVGHCNGHGHTGNGCQYTWDRNNVQQENACMYEPTEEEHMSKFRSQSGVEAPETIVAPGA